MKQTELFSRTRREAPSDETSKNAQLLIRAGFIHKEIAGVYSFLPLGLRVLNNIRKIVAEEMEKLGSIEIWMSTIQNKETWEKTNRWDDKNVDIWFKSKLKNESEIGFGWSHEEPISVMMKEHIRSYADLPKAVHQFQNKLRNETRAKSGVMRCREFLMKDMYYFAATDEENAEFYDRATRAYQNVFEKLGLGKITYITSASGGMFTDKFSHEFQTICEAGEDVIYVNHAKQIALNEEVFNKETLDGMGMKEEEFEKKKAAEVGNIFNFGTKKSEDLGLYFKDRDGKEAPVHLSSYGIGITRLMGVLVEVNGSENSMLWPPCVSPFKYHIIEINSENPLVRETAQNVYKMLERGALYDDRDLRAGEKFYDADLIGAPLRIIISERNVLDGKIEFLDRRTNETKMIAETELKNYLEKC